MTEVSNNLKSSPSVARILLSIILWIIVFGLLAINFGNLLILIAIWYIIMVKPLDDPRRKIRMTIVGVYCLALFLLNIIVMPRALDQYYGRFDPLIKYTQVWAILAYIKLLLAIVIFIKIPKLFSAKGRDVYLLQQKEIRDKEEVEIQKESDALRGEWNAEVKNEIAEALNSGDSAQVEWALSELEYYKSQGVREAEKMLKHHVSGK